MGKLWKWARWKTIGQKMVKLWKWARWQKITENGKMIKMGFIGFRFSSAQLGQVAKNLTENGKMIKNGPGGNFFYGKWENY